MSVTEEPLDLLADYRRETRGYDEAVDEQGRARASHAGALRALAGRDLEALAETVDAQVAGEGVCFHSAVGDEAFIIDPVPRVLGADEWATIEAGLAQRVRALNALHRRRLRAAADRRRGRRAGARDRYGRVPRARDERRASARGHLDRHLRPRPRARRARELPGARGQRAHPQRLLLRRRRPARARRPARPRARGRAAAAGRSPGAAAVRARGRRADARAAAAIALLTDGPENAAYYEHEWAAKAIGVPLIEPEELAARDDIDIVYRRTNADRLDTEVGRLLLEPVRSGRLAVVNAFGTGVADDKLTHAYVEDMIRFYLNEEPLLPSVETFDLGRPEILERALDVFDELVIKPRGGYGGQGVAILPHAEPWDVEAVRQAVLERPTAFVAQRMVMLSSHPTVVDGKLASRHVDLRPYVFLGRDGDARVAPGGLTRVAFDEGALVVNSSQNGGAKDTWVLAG